MKKPLNQLQNPVLPNIKRAPPRFYNAGKGWDVDVGETIKSLQGDIQHTLGDSVLAQSKTYSQHAYGVSSHKDVVNKAFRPPLLRQEDLLPLNRLPRHEVFGRINPNGSYYKAFNISKTDIEKHITDKINSGQLYLYSTKGCPIDFPKDHILPDLKLKREYSSVNAGMRGINIDGDINNEYELQLNREYISKNAGYNGITFDGDINNDYNLQLNRPQTSAHSFANSKYEGYTSSGLENIELKEKLEQTPLTIINDGVNIDTIDYSNKKHKMNDYRYHSATASSNIGVQANNLEIVPQLKPVNMRRGNYSSANTLIQPYKPTPFGMNIK